MDFTERFSKIFPPERYEEYGNLSYEAQSELFRKFKKPFDALINRNEDEANELFPQFLESAIILAVNDNPVAQDFLAYIYKKGRTGVLKPNLLRAYEWGIIASNNYSMLSIDRLKFFFTPAFDALAVHPKLEKVVEKYRLTTDDIEYFFAVNIANTMMGITDLSLQRMSKEEVLPQTFSNVKVRELEKVRDRVLNNMMDILSRD